ncbi:hypothetical protein SEPCBS57363_002300 [Sporothrix epigloea]|uniref:WD repeat protein n=1 Tax=Sporothrix epigloea TaxID=1892477 RepID=A0ABP0DF25_9PEZI
MASIGKSLKSFHNETLAIQLNGGSDGLDTSNSARVTGNGLPVLRGSSAAENMNGNTPLAGRANTNAMARDRDRDRNRDRDRDRDRDAPISLFATRSFNKKGGPGEMSGAASRLVSPAPTSRLLSSRMSTGPNGHTRTASKSPLDMRKAPTPPAKRQKTEKTAQTIDGQVRRDDKHERVLSRSWRTPEAVSLSQPMPGASASATNETGSSSDAKPGLRTSKSFTGLAETVEENRVVYVLDSDDEDSSTYRRASAQALATSSSKVACLPPLKRPFLPGAAQQKRWRMATTYAPSLPPPATSSKTSGDSSSSKTATNKSADVDATGSHASSTNKASADASTAYPSSPFRSLSLPNSVPSVSTRSNPIPPNTFQDRQQQAWNASQQTQTLSHQMRDAMQSTETAEVSSNTGRGPTSITDAQFVSHVEIKAAPSEDKSFGALFGGQPLPGESASRPSLSRAAASMPSVTVAPYNHLSTSAMPNTHAPLSATSLTTQTQLAIAENLANSILPDHSPTVRQNGPKEAVRATGEKLDATVVVDMTPRKRFKLNVDGAAEKTQRMIDKAFVRYTTLSHRPYLCSAHRTFVAQNHTSLPTWLGRDLSQRQQVAGSQNMAKLEKTATTARSAVIHVDFLPDEVQAVLEAVRRVYAFVVSAEVSKKISGKKYSSPEKELKHLLRRRAPEFMQLVVNEVPTDKLPGRYESDVHAFLADASKGDINTTDTKKPLSTTSTLGGPAALTLSLHDRASYTARQQRAAQNTKLNTFVLMREVGGQRSVSGRGRQLLQFTNAVRTLREDSLRLRNEWTNLAGDVTTISWASEDAFICGTTTHMDDRNHQYNRQGNLALASVRKGTVQAYPNHRIARSQVAPHGRTETYDDPWLYTSVVSSDYDATHDLAFTSSFDKTVQMWRVAKDGGAMSHQGTWKHDGKVNFVVVSSCPVCLVATASDVSVKAVRIYRLPTLPERLRGQRISYKTLSCERLVDFEGKPILPDKWSYLPATMRWGISEGTRHLLLVGYSPRGLSTTAEDDDIPEDRRNSGELCLWDGLTGEKWRLVGGTSQNVFEVAWHPTQSCFIAATAPTLYSAVINEQVRTQIRIFRQSTNAIEYGGHLYSEVQTLDCYADDINELALRPNSYMSMYVAAGCTNGTTYVWDSSQGDDPIHALAHGACLEELSGEVISVEDTGVKFVAWGATSDRLYTGSSDGLVKAWNVRTHGASGLSPFVRDVLRCPAPVSFGAFSPGKAQLAVGDASGRVFLLSVDNSIEDDEEDKLFISEDEAGSSDGDDEVNVSANINKGMAPTRPGLLRRSHLAFMHHPPEVIRHPTPPRPTEGATPRAKGTALDNAIRKRESDDEDSGLVRSRAFLSSGQIVVHRNRTIGAVKGPNYSETNLFCRDFHQDGLPGRPLLAQYDRQQQENRPRASSLPSRQRALRSVLPDVGPSVSFSTPPRPFNASVLGTPDPQQSLRRQNAVRRVQALHRENLARDLDVNSLPAETRLALELADRAALLHLDDDQDDYGFVYEELPE